MRFSFQICSNTYVSFTTRSVFSWILHFYFLYGHGVKVWNVTVILFMCLYKIIHIHKWKIRNIQTEELISFCIWPSLEISSCHFTNDKRLQGSVGFKIYFHNKNVQEKNYDSEQYWLLESKEEKIRAIYKIKVVSNLLLMTHFVRLLNVSLWFLHINKHAYWNEKCNPKFSS